MTKLTERAIAAAKPRPKNYRLSDGAGLLLEVRPGGGRAWFLRFMLAGRRRDMGLGVYPSMSLAEARRAARAASDLVRQGVDPIEARERVEKVTTAERQVARDAETRTFRVVAEKLIAVQAPGWTSGKTMASWRLTMDKHAYPVLAEVPIGTVDREKVLEALAPVWSSQPATGRKLQRRIASVLDYAAALGWRSTDNPATGRVLRLTKALPKPPPERKQPSLPWQQVPAFLIELGQTKGMAALALRFGILSAVRSAEVRQARWNEIDPKTRIWAIPPQRMKGGKAREMDVHRVPLTEPMLAVLRQMVVPPLKAGEGGFEARVALMGRAVIFPSRAGTPFSDAALGKCIERLNAARAERGERLWTDLDGREAVPHGFRRSFRSWVDDTRPAEGEAAEKALAHEDADTTRAAYRGSDMLEQRRPLMEAWGTHCQTVT